MGWTDFLCSKKKYRLAVAFDNRTILIQQQSRRRNSFVKSSIRITLSPDRRTGIFMQVVHPVGPIFEWRMIGKSKPPEFSRHHHSILVLDPAGMSDDETWARFVSKMD